MKAIGNRKDSFTLNQLPQANSSETTPMNKNEALAKMLTLPPAREPQTQETTVIRIERVIPRQKGSQGIWRANLKAHGIHPKTIMFPFRTTVEILIPTEEEPKMQKFLKEIDRKPDTSDIFQRMDGTNKAMTEEMKMHVLKIRVTMLEYETNMAGIKYLQTLVQSKLPEISKQSQEEVKDRMNTLLRKKGLPMWATN